MPSQAGKDPKGGLTARGRAEFARKEGAKLKPGVRGRADTPEKMRRKGSYLRRFFGRAKLPPLKNTEGKPTRFALSAHAWGEPIPGTEAAARRLAQKGERLLARYQTMRGPKAGSRKGSPKASASRRGAKR
jgi:hypothetical protein